MKTLLRGSRHRLAWDAWDLPAEAELAACIACPYPKDNMMIDSMALVVSMRDKIRSAALCFADEKIHEFKQGESFAPSYRHQ